MTNFQRRILRQIIQRGGIIAYPTEAVFGFGCRPDDFFAVSRILSLKRRRIDKGLILIASSIEQVLPWIKNPTAKIMNQLKRSWPGHISFVLPAAANCPYWISGMRDTVVVRVSAHPVVQEICKMTGHALISTSANLGGHPPLTTALKVRRQFGSQLDMIVSARVGREENPSQIYDAINDRRLR